MLRRVDLSGNKLLEVPRGLLELGGVLEELNLGNNQILELPAEVRTTNPSTYCVCFCSFVRLLVIFVEFFLHALSGISCFLSLQQVEYTD